MTFLFDKIMITKIAYDSMAARKILLGHMTAEVLPLSSSRFITEEAFPEFYIQEPFGIMHHKDDITGDKSHTWVYKADRGGWPSAFDRDWNKASMMKEKAARMRIKLIGVKHTTTMSLTEEECRSAGADPDKCDLLRNKPFRDGNGTKVTKYGTVIICYRYGMQKLWDQKYRNLGRYSDNVPCKIIKFKRIDDYEYKPHR